MAAEAFIITELTGQRREVQLLDRALPYQKFAAPRTQHSVQRWYGGSSVATIQVLGPRVGDWTIEGMWKTRFLAAVKSVELVGFGDIASVDGLITAEDLVEVFNRICGSGQTLEVRWGPEVRRGIMTDITPTWVRVEDCEWKCSFQWSQVGDRPTARATFVTDTTAVIRRSLDELDLIAAQRPAGILPIEVNEIEARFAAVRNSGAAFTEALARVQTQTVTAIADVQSVQSLAGTVVQAAEALRSGTISDLPYYNLLPADDIIGALRVEAWRRDVGASARTVQAESKRSAASVSDRVTPGAIEVVTVTEGMTLRGLAQRYYGNADAWTVIADANGITGSIVAPGVQLYIPRPSAQGFTA